MTWRVRKRRGIFAGDEAKHTMVAVVVVVVDERIEESRSVFLGVVALWD